MLFMFYVRPYHRYRGIVSFTLAEFVAVATEQIEALLPGQTRHGVTQVPDERTVRFYTAQGVVDKPLGRKGRKSLYGYRHLLQVLAVKSLQSRGIPLTAILAMTAGADNRDLEQMLPAAGVAGSHGLLQGLRRLERPAAGPSQRRIPPAPLVPPPLPTAAEAGPGGAQDAWHRLEIAPGLELHVRAALLAEEQREQLRGALLREIGRMRGGIG